MPSPLLPRIDRLAAHPPDPGRACFADEAGIDFPALAVAVERMRHALVGDEADRAIDVPVAVGRERARCGGDVSVRLPVRRTCERCGGRGEAWDEVCGPCAGAGHTEERREVTIALPRGVNEGDRLFVRLAGRHVVPTAMTLHVTLT
jgi:molecular chaperone DnaJ